LLALWARKYDASMKLNLLTRRLHYWGAIVIALPLLVVIGSGIVLQLKKESTWIQPKENRGTGKVPTITFEQVLNACKTETDAGITSWADIDRIDVRPSRGMMKVQARNSYEIQLDAHTGEVLQVEYRRSDLIESIHDGSWFHDKVKLWIFLPAALVLLGLWITGMYLFWLPIVVKARRKWREP
jgi:uncharacterized iron-regulated membrane protein